MHICILLCKFHPNQKRSIDLTWNGPYNSLFKGLLYIYGSTVGHDTWTFKKTYNLKFRFYFKWFNLYEKETIKCINKE